MPRLMMATAGQRIWGIVLLHLYLENDLQRARNRQSYLYAETYPMHRRRILAQTDEESRSQHQKRRNPNPQFVTSVWTTHRLRPCLPVHQIIPLGPSLASRKLLQNQDRRQRLERSQTFRLPLFPLQRHIVRPEPMLSSVAISPKHTAHTPVRSNLCLPRIQS